MDAHHKSIFESAIYGVILVLEFLLGRSSKIKSNSLIDLVLNFLIALCKRFIKTISKGEKNETV